MIMRMMMLTTRRMKRMMTGMVRRMMRRRMIRSMIRRMRTMMRRMRTMMIRAMRTMLGVKCNEPNSRQTIYSSFLIWFTGRWERWWPGWWEGGWWEGGWGGEGGWWWGGGGWWPAATVPLSLQLLCLLQLPLNSSLDLLQFKLVLKPKLGLS